MDRAGGAHRATETLTVIDGQNAREGINFDTVNIAVVAQNFSVVNGGIIMSAGGSSSLTNNLPIQTRTLDQSVGTIGGSGTHYCDQHLHMDRRHRRADRAAPMWAHVTGGHFNISLAVTVNSGRIINNFGTAIWSGNFSGITLNNGATFNNQAGAVFIIAGNNQGMGDFASSFNNLGTLTKASAGDTTLATVFNNSGLVQVQNGRLVFGSGTSSGTYNVSAGAVLFLCNCFPHTFGPSSSITGAGTLDVEGPSNVVSGSYFTQSYSGQQHQLRQRWLEYLVNRGYDYY